MSPDRRTLSMFELFASAATIAVVIVVLLLALPEAGQAIRDARGDRLKQIELSRVARAHFNYFPRGTYDGFFLGTFDFQTQGLASYEGTVLDDGTRFGGDILLKTWDNTPVGIVEFRASTNQAQLNPASQFSIGLPGTFFHGTSQRPTGHVVVRGSTFDFAGGASVIDSEFLVTPPRGRPDWVAALALRNFPEVDDTPTVLGLWSGHAMSDLDGTIWELSLLVDDQDSPPGTGLLGNLWLEDLEDLGMSDPLDFALQGTVNQSGSIILIGQEVDQGLGRVFVQGDVDHDEFGVATVLGHYRFSFDDGTRDEGVICVQSLPLVD